MRDDGPCRRIIFACWLVKASGLVHFYATPKTASTSAERVFQRTECLRSLLKVHGHAGGCPNMKMCNGTRSDGAPTVAVSGLRR